ncbi:adenylosuccinate synthetase [Candidatus Margulisiibacteriota bacterium]
MSVKVLVGTQWGDEGKGKITDLLAEKVDVVVRYQGGNNAGHTVVLGDKTFKLHLVPSGIFYQNKVCVIGNGVVVDPNAFTEEVEMLRSQGIDVSPENLKVSKTAHIILPEHIERDSKSEDSLGEKKLGTTKRGIGPAYVDKVDRKGLRAEQYGKELAPFLVDNIAYLNEAIAQGKEVFLEGAQGTMLDIDHGTYPFVTSSNPTAGGACTGSGIGPTKIDGVIGVVKAYCTRVGEGPFPSELTDDVGGHLQKEGKEFGATTGRARRCGWLDMVILRYAARVNGLTELAVTKLDILDKLPAIKVCTAYRYKDTIIRDYPSELEVFKECEPVYEEFPGWQADTTAIKEYSQLPANARAYLDFIVKDSGVPISLVSVGSERNQTICR